MYFFLFVVVNMLLHIFIDILSFLRKPNNKIINIFIFTHTAVSQTFVRGVVYFLSALILFSTFYTYFLLLLKKTHTLSPSRFFISFVLFNTNLKQCCHNIFYDNCPGKILVNKKLTVHKERQKRFKIINEGKKLKRI